MVFNPSGLYYVYYIDEQCFLSILFTFFWHASLSKI
jgi:hypothetical protein